ncbi:Smr/MutS family protein [Candidatus Pelagibacter sp.]|uniref:Smr/MutS family protein n=1 Tax=Candidatus Pelagibacter sp. TaxID=2024849 RepID=UPI003F87D7D2
MNYKISDKDIRDWNTFIKSEDKIPNKDLEKKKINTLETKSIDLHGFSLEEANEFVETFINKSFKDGVRKLIIVTGKGLHSKNEADPFVSKDLSILKYSVPEFIKNNETLMKKIIEIKEAEAKDGGSGSFYVYLKKIK